MKVLHITLCAAALAFALTGTASASPIWATGSISFNNVATGYVGTDLAHATTINLDNAGAGLIAGTDGSFACGVSHPQGCVPGLGDVPPAFNAEKITPFIFSVPLLNTYANFLVWGDGTVAGATRYSFSVTNSTAAHITNNDLTIFANGIFADAGGTFLTNNSVLIISLTQAGGPGRSVSWAGSFDTVAAPEPTTLVLFGGALLGLGLIRRRKA